VAGAAIEAVQPPTTTAEIALFGGRFGNDASTALTMATTHPVPSTNTSNHRTVAPGPLCDGTVAAGLQTKQSQPPFPRRIDAPSRFGVLVTLAALTTATTPLFSLFTACNAHPVAAGHLGNGIGALGLQIKQSGRPLLQQRWQTLCRHLFSHHRHLCCSQQNNPQPLQWVAPSSQSLAAMGKWWPEWYWGPPGHPTP
jgi:hypothetical protein